MDRRMQEIARGCGMARGVRFIAALAVGAACFGGAASAHAQLNARTVKNSIWSTTYTTVDGDAIDATLVLNGASGYYETSGGDRGRLYNIQYRLAGNDPFEGQVIGNWSMGGYSGSFSFFADSSTRSFEGQWDFDDGSGGGDWNGRFSRLATQGGGSRPGGGGGGASPPGGGGRTVRGVQYGDWRQHPTKPYYYRDCQFPGGGHQYLIYYDTDPQWVYWFNPKTSKFWCCCPTVHHPDYGAGVEAGQDYFLKCTQPAGRVEDCRFPDDVDGAMVSEMTAQNDQGDNVILDCPPPDLP